MTDTMKVIIGVLLPFLGTTLGAASVFFMKGEMNPKLQKALLGFASGVMVAASVWSLIMPGIEMAEAAGKIAWLPAAAGFLGGMFFLLILDSLIPHLHLNSDKPEGRHTTLGKSFMLVFAVALHNLPEGMAVGVVLAAMLSGESVITAAGAFALAIGIAQAFAAGFPGISRSGSTISTGMIFGVSKETMVEYSFILGIPAILVANIVELKDAIDVGAQLDIIPTIVGIIVAAASGVACIKLLQWILKKDMWKYFGFYCLTLCVVVLIYSILGL